MANDESFFGTPGARVIRSTKALADLFEVFSAAVADSPTLRGWEPALFNFGHIGVRREHDAVSDPHGNHTTAASLVSSIEGLVKENARLKREGVLPWTSSDVG